MKRKTRCQAKGEDKRRTTHKPHTRVYLLIYAQGISVRIHYLLVTMAVSREANLVARGQKYQKDTVSFRTCINVLSKPEVYTATQLLVTY